MADDKIIVDHDNNNRSNQSKVWKYFGHYKVNGEINKQETVCKICLAVKSYKGGNTSNMMTHLTVHHNDLINPPQQPQVKKQVSIESAFSKIEAKPLCRDSKMYQEITKSLTDWIIKGLIPLSTVDDKKFKNFCRSLNPRYGVPCSKTITNVVIPKVYAETKAQLISELEKHEAFGITTDGWTSIATQSYVTG